MNRKRIEQMIPIAMDLLKENNPKILNDDGKLPSNYAGYVSSYDPTIRQSGLLQAVAFYEKEKREDINSLLALVLTKAGYLENTSLKKLVYIVKEASSDYAQKMKLQRLILEAIFACKLAMMTFPKTKEEDKEQGVKS